MLDGISSESPQSSPESVEVVSPAVTSPAPQAPQVTPGNASEVTPQAGSNVPPPWAPSYKFKAAGKEHEIPEYLRSVMKDAETEKQLKELHEKAYGLDLVKTNYQTSQQQLQHFQKNILPQHDMLRKSVDTVVNFKKNNDVDSILEYIGIPPEQVAQWMLQRLQAQELPPEQRAVYEQERNLRKQNYELQERVTNLSQNQQQAQLQSKQMELQTALAKPEVQQAAESYNSRMAQPDAFWNFVCQQADFMERASGQSVNAEQAVQQAMRILGTSIVPGPAPVQGNMGSPNPPVIPNVTGSRNTSPTKKLARSLDDLRKLSKEMAAS